MSISYDDNHYTTGTFMAFIEYIGFGLVGFYGISTLVGYLMPNLFYTYISNISDLLWFGFIAYQSLEVN